MIEVMNEAVSADAHQWLAKSMSHPNIDRSDFYVAYRPFDLQSRSFEELPESTQRFLITTGLYPRQFADIKAFFDTLLQVRIARRNRLERTLEGVSRSIVRQMLASHVRTGNSTLDEQCKAVLQDVLQPEWREHLDLYVEEIDALIWLDMAARAASPGQPTFEQHMLERRRDIESMVDFALQCLQTALDNVKSETKAQWLLEEISRKAEDDGHISDVFDGSSDSEAEDGQWVTVTTKTQRRSIDE